jgi:hypothetical protein
LLFCQSSLLALSNYLLIEDSLYYDFLGSKLSYERITKIIEEGKKWKWLSYSLIPILILIKTFFISVCLYTGAFFSKTDKKLGDFFRLALLAEFIALLPILVKMTWFGFVHRNYSLEDLAYFSPLSVLSLVDRNGIDKTFIYPLQLLNVFELFYWFALAYLLKDLINRNFVQRLGFVASTYGVGLFIWVLFIMFLTVSLS